MSLETFSSLNIISLQDNVDERVVNCIETSLKTTSSSSEPEKKELEGDSDFAKLYKDLLPQGH